MTSQATVEMIQQVFSIGCSAKDEATKQAFIALALDPGPLSDRKQLIAGLDLGIAAKDQLTQFGIAQLIANSSTRLPNRFHSWAKVLLEPGQELPDGTGAAIVKKLAESLTDNT